MMVKVFNTVKELDMEVGGVVEFRDSSDFSGRSAGLALEHSIDSPPTWRDSVNNKIRLSAKAIWQSSVDRMDL